MKKTLHQFDELSSFFKKSQPQEPPVKKVESKSSSAPTYADPMLLEMMAHGKGVAGKNGKSDAVENAPSPVLSEAEIRLAKREAEWGEEKARLEKELLSKERELEAMAVDCRAARASLSALQKRFDAFVLEQEQGSPQQRVPDTSPAEVISVEPAVCKLPPRSKHEIRFTIPSSLVDAEIFPNEYAERILAALAEKVREEGRDRQNAVFRALLDANPSTGILQERREAIRDLFETLSRMGAKELESLSRLGFQCVRKSMHYRFSMAGLHITVACTPSDYRANHKRIAEFNNRFF